MGRITIIGAGWTEGQLTLDAVEALSESPRILLHTDRCGCAAWLERKAIPYESLDSLYEAFEDFDAHADAAARAVIDASKGGDVAYVVFDVRDRSAVRLCELLDAEVRIIAGPPAEGALLAFALGETRCVEASDWEDFHLSAYENCLVRELDGRALAGEVKLRLMEAYPEESEIWLLRGQAAPERLRLYELDRAEKLDHRTCALIPAARDIMKLERFDFDHLNEIIRLLCDPEGCPWDRAQTHESLRPYMLEEAYEVIDAIDERSPEHLYDELGDMLLQISLHAEIARRHGEFDITDVTTAICEKMIQRHTHVFGRDRADDAEEVLGLWSRNKMAERGQKTRTETLKDITRALPATLRAVKVFKRCADAGLSDVDAAAVRARCAARLEAVDDRQDAALAVGELMMLLCDYARLRNVDPELAINRAADHFISRFEAFEAEIAAEGGNFDGLPPETLRKYWDLVKL